jgi:hypothetical protein
MERVNEWKATLGRRGSGEQLPLASERGSRDDFRAKQSASSPNSGFEIFVPGRQDLP